MIELSKLDRFRIIPPSFWQGAGVDGDDQCGCFEMKYRPGALLRIIATVGEGWDHVSVSHRQRCPTWEEMSWVAGKFFHPTEVAMQLHVNPEDHINYHPHCLHWWRPLEAELPLPPAWMVGPKKRERETI